MLKRDFQLLILAPDFRRRRGDDGQKDPIGPNAPHENSHQTLFTVLNLY